MYLRIVLLVLAIFIRFTSNGQTLNEVKSTLAKVEHFGQIEQLKINNPNWIIYDDKTMYSDSIDFPHIINAKVGDIVIKKFNSKSPDYLLKILEEKNEELCKVKYIYLNGNEFSKFQIDSLRTIILNRFYLGESFEVLAGKYTMDSNPTGELDWFPKGVMVDEFDNAVRKRIKEELFTVDVESKKWYYVVLKTNDNRFEKAKLGILIKYTP